MCVCLCNSAVCVWLYMHANLSIVVCLCGHITIYTTWWFQISVAACMQKMHIVSVRVLSALWSSEHMCHDAMYVCLCERLCGCVCVCLTRMKLTLILSSLRQIHCSACRHCHGNKPVSLGTREKAKFKLQMERERHECRQKEKGQEVKDDGRKGPVHCFFLKWNSMQLAICKILFSYVLFVSQMIHSLQGCK